MDDDDDDDDPEEVEVTCDNCGEMFNEGELEDGTCMFCIACLEEDDEDENEE